MPGLSFSNRGMTIFVSRCISGADAFSAYACKTVIVVPLECVAAERAVPAVAAIATSTAATASARTILVKRIRFLPLLDERWTRDDPEARSGDHLHPPVTGTGLGVERRRKAGSQDERRRAHCPAGVVPGIDLDPHSTERAEQRGAEGAVEAREHVLP